MKEDITSKAALKAFVYFVRYIKNPAKATENILSEKNMLWTGCLFLLYFGIGYSIVAYIAHYYGAMPDSPFISIIPLEKWYLIQSFTTIPITFIVYAIYATVCYQLCRLMSGIYKNLLLDPQPIIPPPVDIFMIIGDKDSNLSQYQVRKHMKKKE